VPNRRGGGGGGVDTDHMKVVISQGLIYIKSGNIVRKSGKNLNFHIISIDTASALAFFAKICFRE